MKKTEEKVYKKYLKSVTKLVKNRYRKISESETMQKRVYLKKDKTSNSKLKEIRADIYKSYAPMIDTEIKYLMHDVVSSDKYASAIKHAENTDRRKLHYKALRRYRELPIGIPKDFLDELYNEVNDNKKIFEKNIDKEELKYLTLLSFYCIIDCIRDNKIVKLGTGLRIWCDKRDVRINLPCVRNRILSDRMIPKVKLNKSFGYNLFQKINEDNAAIINYYKAKTERFLILLKLKKGKANA